MCLAEAMHDLYRADLPANHEHLHGFKGTDGAFYTLLRTNLSEALFVDERLHQKTLIIIGRTFPKRIYLKRFASNPYAMELSMTSTTTVIPVRYVSLHRGIVCVVRHPLS